jgi:hypothetical protein
MFSPKSMSNLGRLTVDLQVFWASVYSCTHWLRSRNSPPPDLGSYMRALSVSQDRRHLFGAPCVARLYSFHRYSPGHASNSPGHGLPAVIPAL